MTSVIEQETRTTRRFLRLPEVVARTRLSWSTIYVRMEKVRFPHPVSLGCRSADWNKAEVDERIRQRIYESRCGAE